MESVAALLSSLENAVKANDRNSIAEIKNKIFDMHEKGLIPHAVYEETVWQYIDALDKWDQENNWPPNKPKGE